MPSSETNDIKIMTKSVVCEDSTLVGDITIMQGCVIHTSATIIAEAGPVILGENCIVEEYASIIHRNSDHKELSTLTIGSNNIFEVGCMVEAYKIGEKNLFESKCYVGSNVAVANGCIIGAGIRLNQVVELPENTVIYRDSNQQREAIEKHTSQTLQIDFLRKVLPNYHHLRKPNCDSKKIKIVV